MEIIPTDLPKQPAPVEAASFEDAIKEAFAKRPELQEEALNLLNAEIDVKANRNALLPTLSVGGFYESQGLAGNSSILGPSTVVSSGVPIVDATGAPVLNNGAPIFVGASTAPVTGTMQQGFGTAQNQIFHNVLPEYAGQLTLTLPLRNRAAQAEYARAILSQRQLQTTERQLRNAALLDVRNSYIALTQGRAQVAAAMQSARIAATNLRRRTKEISIWGRPPFTT